ncbi:MAG: tetratricopeptide repeat protein [Candidatus Marinimicrobia bacterium]|nr:tetratricopeptide repeat protein [Candidatus Neomarinimicrobiota bacterium]
MTRTGLILLLLGVGQLAAQTSVTRLSFTRPGGMMRVPTSSSVRSNNLFTAGFVLETVNIVPFNNASGVYFDAELTKNLRIGLSSVTTADTSANLDSSSYSPPLEIGLHFQQRIWTYGNISFSLGLHDIVLRQSDDGDFDIDPDLISILGVISSEQSIGSYNLNTYMGFGTGAIGGAGSSSDSTGQIKLGVYAGFQLVTPIMAKRGGLVVMSEFDGSGINIGVRVPLTTDYQLMLGAVHVESLPKFGTQADGEALDRNAPSIVLGLNLSVPRIEGGAAAKKGLDELGPRPDMASSAAPEQLLPAQIDSTLKGAEYIITLLRDSLRIAQFESKNLFAQLAQKDQHGFSLADSVRNMTLRLEMMKSNLNTTMRHLTISWQHFFEENYREALQEIEMAIQLNPDLAIAYARRGSIYYKLGDTQRATINWNLALKLDSEYDDVRNILRALKENRLNATSFSQQ